MRAVDAEIGANLRVHGDTDRRPRLTAVRTLAEKRSAVTRAVRPLWIVFEMPVMSTDDHRPPFGPRGSTVSGVQSSMASRLPPPTSTVHALPPRRLLASTCASRVWITLLQAASV